MNLPDRRESRAETPEPKPGIRPRPIQSRKAEGETPAAVTGVLHFSCPSCLRMMSAEHDEEGIVSCPSCQARVMPPQLVRTGGSGKAHQPPPTKTG